MTKFLFISLSFLLSGFAGAESLDTDFAPGTLRVNCENARDAFRHQTGVYRVDAGGIRWAENGDLAVDLVMSFMVCRQTSEGEFGFVLKSPYERVVYRHSPAPPQGERFIQAFEAAWVDARSLTDIFSGQGPLELLDRQRLSDEARQTYSLLLPQEAVNSVDFASGETLKGSFLVNILKSGHYVYSDGSRIVHGIPYQPFLVKFEIERTPQGFAFQKFEVQ